MPLRNHAPISTISRSVTSHFLHDNHLSLLASPRHTDTHHARADAPCARQIVSPPAQHHTHAQIIPPERDAHKHHTLQRSPSIYHPSTLYVACVHNHLCSPPSSPLNPPSLCPYTPTHTTRHFFKLLARRVEEGAEARVPGRVARVAVREEGLSAWRGLERGGDGVARLLLMRRVNLTCKRPKEKREDGVMCECRGGVCLRMMRELSECLCIVCAIQS